MLNYLNIEYFGIRSSEGCNQLFPAVRSSIDGIFVSLAYERYGPEEYKTVILPF
ncbi:hypothetical protein [Bacteroides sp. 14(A)]|uniref:hypothetical protein n=1 Tax=Bacteroides sp. 14(A) TaxID=1163670 RepID=UPI0004B1C5B9|nr:hypothetical protein [Bacteroides sp. 14(A)]